MADNRLVYLVNQYLAKEISTPEQEELQLLIAASDDDQLQQSLAAVWENHNSSKDLSPEKAGIMLAAILDKQSINTVPVRGVHFMRRWAWAAAILLVLASAAYLLINKSNRQPSTVSYVPADIAPGGNKALLTLSDGTTITLDSAANGAIAQQGNANVVKLTNGQLVYRNNPESKTNNSVILYNSMHTPRGGQYQLILSDGTKVWLNAASSITYPTAFTGPNRQVKITGEAYLEVAKDKAHPFLVDVDGQSTVEVLGTSFNINAYADEGDIKTTLVEGSVKLSHGNQQAILKPGQQAIQSLDTTAGIIVKSTIDLSQILAWKNGLFYFDNVTVETAMRQLERWYDIEVRYKGKVPAITLDGKIYRNVSLPDVLEPLSKMGLRFKMEGKTLVIL